MPFIDRQKVRDRGELELPESSSTAMTSKRSDPQAINQPRSSSAQQHGFPSIYPNPKQYSARCSL